MESKILSPRERQVLHLIAYENTNVEIAEMLYISDQTVKSHRKNLLQKLSVKNTAGLVRRGFELGLLSTPKSKSLNRHRNLGLHLMQGSLPILLVIFLCFFPGADLFSQLNDQNDVINKTIVEYDSCSRVAIVTFPLNNTGEICPSVNILRWMEIYSLNPNATETLEAKLSASASTGFIHEGSCSQTSFTTPVEANYYCRPWDLCSDGNRVRFELKQGLDVPGGIDGERYAVITVPSLTGKIRLIGDYDIDNSGTDNGFDVNFIKQDLSPGADCPGYKTPSLDFGSDIRFVNVVSLPEPVCGDESGLSITSVGEALNASHTKYLRARRGESFSFLIHVGSFNQLVFPTSPIEVFYISDAGTQNESVERIYQSSIASPVGDAITGALQVFSVTHTPQKGSLGDIIHIQITATSGTYNLYIPVVVEGVVDDEVPILGSLITPQIPYLVVHDPPGDGSFGEFIQTTNYCRSSTTTYEESLGGGFEVVLKAGVAGSAGFLGVDVPFEISTSVKQEFGYTETETESEVSERCFEVTNGFKTSDVQLNPGDQSDLFIGLGETWFYGVFDDVVVDQCDFSIINRFSYYSDPAGLTDFAFTAADIQADIDRQLEIANNPDSSTLVRDRAFNQVDVWRNVLAKNEENKANVSAASKIQSYSYGANNTRFYEESLTVSEVRTRSFDIAIESNTALNLTFMVGATGFSGGPEISFTQNEGGTTSNSTTNTEVLKYTLADDDLGDFFDVTAYRDPDYGTPIFRLDDGTKTSCPYEGGIQRDQPRVFANWFSGGILACGSQNDDVFISQIPRDQRAFLNLNVCNDGLEDRPFRIELEDNNKGAVVELASTVLNNVNNVIEQDVNAQQCTTLILQVGRNQGDAPSGYNIDSLDYYENLTIKVYPNCEDGPGLPSPVESESVEMTISAYFGDKTPPPCAVACLDVDGDGIENCEDLCFQKNDAALDFDGVDDFIEVPTFASLDNITSGDFSISAWVFPTDDGFNTIASKGSGLNSTTSFIFIITDYNNQNFLGPDSRGKLGLFIGDNITSHWLVAESSVQVPLHKWSHVAVSFVKEGLLSKAQFWIDGVYQGDSPDRFLSAPYLNNNDLLQIGRQGNIVNDNHFMGRIDELSIWSKAFSQTEVTDMMSIKPDTMDTDLLVYYDFNDASPCVVNTGNTTLGNLSPNNADGTLNNFNLQAVCTSNWTTGSNKIANCTSCLAQLDITSSMGILEGIYSAGTEIRVMSGAQFSPGKSVTLSAPNVLFGSDVNVPLTTNLSVNQDGCQD